MWDGLFFNGLWKNWRQGCRKEKKKGPESEMGWGGVVNMKENLKLMKKCWQLKWNKTSYECQQWSIPHAWNNVHGKNWPQIYHCPKVDNMQKH